MIGPAHKDDWSDAGERRWADHNPRPREFLRGGWLKTRASLKQRSDSHPGVNEILGAGYEAKNVAKNVALEATGLNG